MIDLTYSGSLIRRWRENPRAFAYEELKFNAGDPWQDEVLQVFPSQDPDKLRMSLQACTGPGKTAVLAVCNWNFLSCYGSTQDHPQGLCTSITEDNLNSNLWKEMLKWQSRSEYLQTAFKWSATRIASVDFPGTWFLEARTWSRRADTESIGRTLSGLHAPFVMVTIDEAGDVPVRILLSGEQIFSAKARWAKLLIAGNPTSLEGSLHHAATTQRHLYYVVIVTGDPDDPRRSKRVNIENAREQIRMYGRENAWVKATILGQFPPSSINALLGIEDVEAAMSRQAKPEAYEWAQKRLGVDVARFGDDRTVIFPRQGLVAFQPKVMRHLRDSSVSTDIADRVMAAKATWGSELEFFDATGGWAAGAVDVLRTNRFSPINVQFHAKAMDPRYKNKRAELWWTMAEWVKGQGVLPRIGELTFELIAPTYTFGNGQFVLEEKDQVKKRLGRSPDLADALALTFGLPDMSAGMQASTSPRHQAVQDFDPYRDT